MPEFLQPPDRKRHPDGVHRDHWKRPIYFTPDNPDAATKCGWQDETGWHGCNTQVQGRPYQRVTTFVGVLEDTFRIEKWKMRNVAIGLALKDHLLLKVAGQINPEDPHENKGALESICEEAMTAADAAAGRDSGTALHELTERLDRGDEAVVPEAAKPDVEAYRDLAHRHQLRWDDIEIPTVIDGVYPTKTAYGVGGRFDRITGHWIDPVSPWPCPNCGKSRRVVDLKTQRSMEWGPIKTAMQLTAYAVGDRYDTATGKRDDLNVCQCVGYVVHLPVGKAEATLHRADLVKASDHLRVAYAVWQARQQQDGLLEAVPAPDIATSTGEPSANTAEGARQLTGEGLGEHDGPDIYGLISIAADRNNLLGLWRHFDAEGRWTEDHTLAAKQRLARLEANAS